MLTQRISSITIKTVKIMTKKNESEEMTFEPYVMSAEETLEFLDAKGIEYEICDSPVPVVSNSVERG
jgi:hypothetical protein